MVQNSLILGRQKSHLTMSLEVSYWAGERRSERSGARERSEQCRLQTGRMSERCEWISERPCTLRDDFIVILPIVRSVLGVGENEKERERESDEGARTQILWNDDFKNYAFSDNLHGPSFSFLMVEQVRVFLPRHCAGIFFLFWSLPLYRHASILSWMIIRQLPLFWPQRCGFHARQDAQDGYQHQIHLAKCFLFCLCHNDIEWQKEIKIGEWQRAQIT